MTAAIAFFIKEIDKKSVISPQTIIVKKAAINLPSLIGRLVVEFKCVNISFCLTNIEERF